MFRWFCALRDTVLREMAVRASETIPKVLEVLEVCIRTRARCGKIRNRGIWDVKPATHSDSSVWRKWIRA